MGVGEHVSSLLVSRIRAGSSALTWRGALRWQTHFTTPHRQPQRSRLAFRLLQGEVASLVFGNRILCEPCLRGFGITFHPAAELAAVGLFALPISGDAGDQPCRRARIDLVSATAAESVTREGSADEMRPTRKRPPPNKPSPARRIHGFEFNAAVDKPRLRRCHLTRIGDAWRALGP